jgi:hypothetical protein
LPQLEVSKAESNDFLSLKVKSDDHGDIIDTSTQTSDQVEESLLKRTREFNQKCREDPYNINLWLDFVKFQDEFYTQANRRQRASLLEKKITILKKALESNPDNEVLLLAYLREAQQLWESDKILTLWKRTVEEHARNPTLWKAYILFLQTTFSSFSVSSMREVYAHAIKMLQAVVFEYATSGGHVARLQELESALLDIFVTCCMFERQAGYSEKAVALFQALLEFNLFCSQRLLTYQQQVRSFARFWEAEEPRIGDNVRGKQRKKEKKKRGRERERERERERNGDRKRSGDVNWARTGGKRRNGEEEKTFLYLLLSRNRKAGVTGRPLTTLLCDNNKYNSNSNSNSSNNQ